MTNRSKRIKKLIYFKIKVTITIIILVANISAICGDFNTDGSFNIADAFHLFDFMFGKYGGVYSIADGDINCDGITDIADVEYMILIIWDGHYYDYPCVDCPNNINKDRGNADIVSIHPSEYRFIDDFIKVEVHIKNDAAISGFYMPLKWNSPNLVFDSVSTVGSRWDHLNGSSDYYYNYQSDAMSQTVHIGFHYKSTGYTPILDPGSGLVFTAYYSYVGQDIAEDVVIDTTDYYGEQLYLVDSLGFTYIPKFSPGILSIENKNVVGKWGLDYQADNIVYDCTINNNNGTLFNGEYQDGYINEALYFGWKESPGWVHIDNDELFNSESFTYSAWVKLPADYWWHENGTYDYVYDDAISIMNHHDILFSIIYQFLRFSAYGVTIGTDDPIPENQWVHFAGEYDNNSHELRLYINGDLTAIAENIVLPKNYDSQQESLTEDTLDLYIGKKVWTTGEGNYFYGWIDEVKIMDRALHGEYPDDADNDGIDDTMDNCLLVDNPCQVDQDGDGIGDLCDDYPWDYDNDIDGDGLCATIDNCPEIYNPSQEDVDNDDIGDSCDECVDYDQDGYGDPGYISNICQIDNCPCIYNPDQEDSDEDGIGDSCIFNSDTPVGSDVIVNLGSRLSLIFNEVLQSGVTEMVISPNGPAIPGSYLLTTPFLPVFYNISTSSEYDDSINLCLNYNDSGLFINQELDLKLLHYVNDNWVDITDIINTDENLICGTVAELSPFIVVFSKNYKCGDANGDETVNIADASYIINAIFFGGSQPDPEEAADANDDGSMNIADASYLINWIFFGGNPPCGG